MTVARGWNEIRADARDHRDNEQRESRDEEAKSFSKQVTLSSVAENHSRAHGKKYDAKTADERQVQTCHTIARQDHRKKQACNQQQRAQPETMREKWQTAWFFQQMTLRDEISQSR